MEKERLIHLLNTPGDADSSDFEQLEELIKLYPFSQTLHILLAKIGFLLEKPEKNQYLKTAAIYASLRGSLKRVIEEEDYPGKVFPILPYQDLPAFETFSDEDTSERFVLDEETESSSIFREVMRNLEKLKALREQFQFLELNPEESAPGIPEKEEIKKAIEEQKIASNEVGKSISSINEVAQTFAAGSEEISGSSEEIAAMSEKLKETVTNQS